MRVPETEKEERKGSSFRRLKTSASFRVESRRGEHRVTVLNCTIG